MTLKLASISDVQRERWRSDAIKLREYADEIEAGDISEFVFVANRKSARNAGQVAVLGAHSGRKPQPLGASHGSQRNRTLARGG